jgi:hypothetical protein
MLRKNGRKMEWDDEDQKHEEGDIADLINWWSRREVEETHDRSN